MSQFAVTGLPAERPNAMPEICRFLGVVITMYFNDHNPPHFHARYEDFRAIIAIDSLELREGTPPPRVLGFVMEWAKLHQAELSASWTMLAEKGMFDRIPPLV
jgi:hypothetical protein